MSSCFTNPKKWHLMEIGSKFIGPLRALQIWKHMHWAFRYMIGWTHIEHCLNTCKCMWMPMSEYWTPPEHPLSAHECQWVSIEQPLNIHWVYMTTIEWVWITIECAWPPLSNYWMQLTMVWHLESSHLCQNWACPEHLWVHKNANEWVLNTPWIFVSASERQWVSIDHLLITHWVHMATFE